MPLIWTNEGEMVVRIHYRPDLLTEEQKQGSVLLESLPEPEEVEGHYPVGHYSEEQGYYYTYEPLPEDEEPQEAI